MTMLKFFVDKTRLRNKNLENIVEMEKMLVTSIFFFSHNVSNSFCTNRAVESQDCVVKG